MIHTVRVFDKIDLDQ